jgi:hypothetical protein
MTQASPTILALVEVDEARCPHRLDFLLGVARALQQSARVTVGAEQEQHYGQLALARLEGHQRLDRHVAVWAVGAARGGEQAAC